MRVEEAGGGRGRTGVGATAPTRVLPEILAAGLDAVSVVGLEDGRFRDLNDAFVALTGWTRDEALGRTSLELGFWVDPEERRAYVRALRDQGGRVSQMQIPIRVRSGDIRLMEVSSHLIEVDGETCVVALNRDITDRTEAEQSVRRKEARNQALLAALPDLMFVIDRDGTYLDYKAARRDDLALPPETFLGRRITDLLPPELADRLMTAVLDALGAQDVVTVEYELAGMDGRARTWEARIAACSPDEVVCIVRDVSEQRDAEETLRQSEERYRRIVETASEGIVILTPEADIAFANERMAEMLGTTVDELIGGPLTDFKFDEDREVLARNLDARRRGVASRHDTRFRRADGTELSSWISAQPIFDEHGTYMGVLGMVTDVSHRRRAEQALRESEERLRRLSDATFEGIAIHEDGMIIDSNRAFAEMFGYEPHEVIGHPALEFVAPPSRDLVSDRIRSKSAEVFEVIGLRKNGSTLPVEVRPRMIPLEGRRVYFAAIRDITERKQSEQELLWSLEIQRAATERLRRLDDLKDTFLRAVSHELRTPLAAILWIGETLEARGAKLGREHATELYAGLITNARALDRLLTRLLDIDRLNQGGVVADPGPVDLSAVIDRVVAQSGAAISHPVDVVADPLVASVDEAMFERIVDNLVTNAVRHTPPGTAIRISLAPHEAGIMLIVDDRGPGIPDRDKQGIFEPFRRGSQTGPHASGMGVGLSLVRRFAELQGGRAWMQDREGGGSSFRVALPYSPAVALPEDD